MHERESITMTDPKSFFTVQSEGKNILEIQRSRFICQAKHVQSVDEAIHYIQEISKTYHDATHHCYAYIIDQNHQKSSDDGEPAGTAGRPILETLLHYQLKQSLIVITRYFGGIKLGAGGLVRAYRKAAHQAIEAAGIAQKKIHQQILCTFDYSQYGKIEHYIQTSNYINDLPTFSDKVHWSIWIPLEQRDQFIKAITDQTQGQIQIEYGETEYKTVT